MKNKRIILELTPEEVRLLAYGAIPHDLKTRLEEIAYHIDGQAKLEDALSKKENAQSEKPESQNYIEKIRQKYPKAYFSWTTEEDEKLKVGFTNGKSIQELSKIFQRQPGGIHSRLIKLGLIEDSGSHSHQEINQIIKRILGITSFNHRTIQNQLVNIFEEFGFNAKQEAHIGAKRNGLIDLVARKNKYTIGIEIDDATIRHKSIDKLNHLKPNLAIFILKSPNRNNWKNQRREKSIEVKSLFIDLSNQIVQRLK